MYVLNFHGVGEPTRMLEEGEQDVWLSRSQFCEFLDVVINRSDVRLTFDDGNGSDVAIALPELSKRNLKACFFVCAGRLGANGFLGRADVRSLQAAGMSIGSHGMEHVRWRKLNSAQVQQEIVQAKQALEHVTQTTIVEAACPFGEYDRRSLQALREAGFKRVYTSDGGPATNDDWLVARNTVRCCDSAESIQRMLSDSNKPVRFTHRAKRLIKQWR
jgi:peptidoglycan/xylan/chitin deacetylase (PgdA/CDA1 family)